MRANAPRFAVPRNAAIVDLDGEVVDLSFAPGVADDELIAELCFALRTNETVCGVNLSNNMISETGAEHIGAMLNANPRISALALENCQLSEHAAQCICRCARKHGALESLRLARNPFGDSVVPELVRLLLVGGNAPGGANSAQTSGPAASGGAASAAEPAAPQSVLAELLLTDTRLTFSGCVELARAMVENRSLLYCALPHTAGYALLNEVQMVLTRNWALHQGLGSKLRMAAALAEQARRAATAAGAPDSGGGALAAAAALDTVSVTSSTAARIASAWTIGGVAEEHRRQGRMVTVAAGPDTWADPEIATHQLFLTLLDRKSQLMRAESESARRERASVASSSVRSPRLPSIPRSSARKH